MRFSELAAPRLASLYFVPHRNRPCFRPVGFASGALFATLSLACTGRIASEPRNASPGPESHAPDSRGGAAGMSAASGASSGGAPAASCAPVLPPGAWKLTPTQIRNTLAAFAPGAEAEADKYGTVVKGLGAFSNAADRLDLSLPVTTAIVDASERIGAAAVQALAAAGERCVQDGADDAVCANKVVETLGRRAFRRPVTTSERDELTAFYRDQRASLPVGEAWAQVASALAMAPEMLFRFEVGTAGSGGRARLTPWEIASRLSYGLTDGPPDNELMASADDGRLATREGRVAQVRRLLGGASTVGARTAFLRELLPWADVTAAGKDRTANPDFSAATVTSMVAAIERRVGDWLTQQPPTWRALLTSEQGYVDAPLAKLYGLTSAAGDALAPQALGRQRRGVLTEPALLASLASFSDSRPVHRGHFVAAQLLCRDLPPPPAGVPPLAAVVAASPLAKDRLAVHTREPQCAACHRLMDPFGLVLESYDTFGRYRTQQDGHTIDPSGRLPLDDTTSVQVDDAAGLADSLASAPAARACFVAQQARWLLGAAVPEEARCWLDSLSAEFAKGDGDVNQLLIRLLTDDVTVERSVP